MADRKSANRPLARRRLGSARSAFEQNCKGPIRGFRRRDDSLAWIHQEDAKNADAGYRARIDALEGVAGWLQISTADRVSTPSFERKSCSMRLRRLRSSARSPRRSKRE